MLARLPFRSSLLVGLVACLAALSSAACSPKIGDDCATSLDCSQQGDRLCDITQPEGYCTVFNCEPDTCPPGEGVCVAFDNELDPACGPLDDSRWARFERTFCMQACVDDDDCRPEYTCVDPKVRFALIIDAEPIEKKVCVVRTTAVSTVPASQPGVCGPSSADFNDWTPYTPAGGGGGSGGGGGGAGGAGGG